MANGLYRYDKDYDEGTDDWRAGIQYLTPRRKQFSQKQQLAQQELRQQQALSILPRRVLTPEIDKRNIQRVQNQLIKDVQTIFPSLNKETKRRALNELQNLQGDWQAGATGIYRGMQETPEVIQRLTKGIQSAYPILQAIQEQSEQLYPKVKKGAKRLYSDIGKATGISKIYDRKQPPSREPLKAGLEYDPFHGRFVYRRGTEKKQQPKEQEQLSIPKDVPLSMGRYKSFQPITEQEQHQADKLKALYAGLISPQKRRIPEAQFQPITEQERRDASLVPKRTTTKQLKDFQKLGEIREKIYSEALLQKELSKTIQPTQYPGIYKRGLRTTEQQAMLNRLNVRGLPGEDIVPEDLYQERVHIPKGLSRREIATRLAQPVYTNIVPAGLAIPQGYETQKVLGRPEERAIVRPPQKKVELSLLERRDEAESELETVPYGFPREKRLQERISRIDKQIEQETYKKIEREKTEAKKINQTLLKIQKGKEVKRKNIFSTLNILIKQLDSPYTSEEKANKINQQIAYITSKYFPDLFAEEKFKTDTVVNNKTNDVQRQPQLKIYDKLKSQFGK